MKIRFFFHETVSGNRLHRSLWRAAETCAASPNDLNKYLLGAINTDFSENRHGDVDEALAAIEKIENGELKQFETGGQGFAHQITRARVRFEHNVFGECPEWPIWCCTLAQYQTALRGYRRFLDMPKSLNSELFIDLPEGSPDDC